VAKVVCEVDVQGYVVKNYKRHGKLAGIVPWLRGRDPSAEHYSAAQQAYIRCPVRFKIEATGIALDCASIPTNSHVVCFLCHAQGEFEYSHTRLGIVANQL
jgi:hypothetical protein